MPIYLQHGNLIDYVPPTDTSTEDVIFMGGLVGIPQAFIPAGELGALSVDGVYMFNKKDGVSVNLGEVVKYCGTTKLAQDSNADLTLGVAVADADADDFGVKVKINSVLPTDGGGGGGGGEVALCGESGLYLDNGGNVAIKYCGNSAINADANGVYLAVCGDSGLSIQNGELVASGGGGGGGEVSIDTSRGLNYYNGCSIGISIGSGLDFDCGQLVATGAGMTYNNSFIVTGNSSPGDPGDVVNIGYNTCSNSSRSVILGAYTDNDHSPNAVVIGYCSSVNCNAQGGIAIGSGAEVAENGCGSIAIGHDAKSRSPSLGFGNIVIGNGINPYSDSALLIVSGNGDDSSNSREGILLYSQYSSFLETAGVEQGGGIAYVTSEDKGASWTSQCSIKF